MAPHVHHSQCVHHFRVDIFLVVDITASYSEVNQHIQIRELGETTKQRPIPWSSRIPKDSVVHSLSSSWTTDAAATVHNHQVGTEARLRCDRCSTWTLRGQWTWWASVHQSSQYEITPGHSTNQKNATTTRILHAIANFHDQFPVDAGWQRPDKCEQ